MWKFIQALCMIISGVSVWRRPQAVLDNIRTAFDNLQEKRNHQNNLQVLTDSQLCHLAILDTCRSFSAYLTQHNTQSCQNRTSKHIFTEIHHDSSASSAWHHTNKDAAFPTARRTLNSRAWWSIYSLIHDPLLLTFTAFTQALAQATGRQESRIKKEYAESGDLGLVASSARGMQKTMFKPQPLTLQGVFK